MRLIYHRILFSLATTAAILFPASPIFAVDLLPQIVAKTKPATVQIVSLDENWSPLKTGSGFFITSNGLVVTNFHVIEGASHLIALTNEGASYQFERVIANPQGVDLAILKFAAEGVAFIRLGQTADAVEGQRVLVIGSPKSLQGTVSDGIISAFRNDRSIIQITAPISHGSSGSPVLNELGQLIGVATMIRIDGENLGFAIAVEQVRRMLVGAGISVERSSDFASVESPLQNSRFPDPNVDNDHSVPSPFNAPVAAQTQPPAVAAYQNMPPWPDGMVLSHPNRSVNTRVVKVAMGDTLKIRGGAGTRFGVVAEIPAEARDITAYDEDQMWDGDTFWVPVEWHGVRGYVGRSHLP